MEFLTNTALIEWFQNLGDGLLPLMKSLTFLGSEIFYILILPILLWCYNVRFGIRVGLILLTSVSLNAVLKVVIGLPRPYWIHEQVRALGTDPFFSMPSGHAQNSVSLFGRMGTLLQKTSVRILLAALILLISVSRLFLGVHFPVDLLIGWLIGIGLIIFFVRMEDRLVDWLKLRSKTIRILLPVLLSLTVLVTGVLVTNLASQRGFPESWKTFASEAAPEAEPIDPTGVDPFVSGSGILMGFGVGVVLLTDWGQFDPKGKPLQLIVRYVVGLFGVVILFFGLRYIFPTGSSLVAHALRYVRYASIGLWIAYFGPQAFVRLRLA
jgi:membrane-associated phospholipid phosphatase